MLCRFIPVLTGNTHITSPFKLTHAVYPRTYGEHSGFWSYVSTARGLSPYLRGTLTYFYHWGPQEAVYPRTYGEHNIRTGWKTAGAGLSPYLRGTLLRSLNQFVLCRFIPVLTGNTPWTQTPDQ
ncbi:conserved hypothetical protein [Xenorhabdus nematophila str. Websteri]|nr:conserved hypothetical protein [Xenorhabdus nematophila str. Websteri]